MSDLAQDRRVQDLLTQAARAGIDRLDAQLLLLHALQRDDANRGWLIAHDQDVVEAGAAAGFDAMCARRAVGEPLAYLVGHKEFHGLDLRVDADVLVPRPDTETLVDWALSCMDGRLDASVLDMGTGSGAIALALQRARPGDRVCAIDASEEALAVARSNAERLALPVRFVRSDWFAKLAGERFDLVASNPPYIAEGDPHLPALGHEPPRALVAGIDGLADIRRIVQAAPGHLNEGGWLLLEHGHDQATEVRALLAQRGFESVQSRNDLAGIARCSGGIWRTVK